MSSKGRTESVQRCYNLHDVNLAEEMALPELEAASKFPAKLKKVKEMFIINYWVWSLKLVLSETGSFWKHMTETARRGKGGSQLPRQL